MKKVLFSITKLLYYMMGMMLLMSNSVHAYFDPSATTYIIQVVGALLVAAGALFTVFRHKISSIFKKNNSDNKKKEIIVEEDD